MNNVKKHIFLFVIIIFFSFTQYVYSQDIVVLKGYVKDTDGAVVGATVLVSGTNNGTITDNNGYYELKIKKDSKNIIKVSFIGKKTIKKPYKGESSLDFFLEADNVELKEFVVKAYPNINDIDVRAKTGSVELVPIKQIQNTPVANIATALQGTTTGLQVINRGELGTKPQIRIRGNSSLRQGDGANEPLYILDGKMISSETFYYLNPDDIEEMKVLKDAVASALYGIKAANGVIEISSKRASEGQSVSYHFQSGITLRTPQIVKMMNTEEKLELERLLKNPATPGYLYSKDYIEQHYKDSPQLKVILAQGQKKLDSLKQINTDWYKELARINTYQKHDISFRRGSNKTSYLASVGFMHQGGELEGNDITRFSGRLMLDQAVGDKAVIGIGINATYGKINTPNGSNYSPASLIYQLNPYEQKDKGNLVSYPGRKYSDLINQYSRESSDKNIGISASLNWRIGGFIDIQAITGVDFSLSEQIAITPPSAFSEKNIGRPKNERGTLTQAKNTITNITSNIRVNYNRTFGKHDLTLGFNSDVYSTILDNINITGHGLYGNIKSGAAIDNSITGTNRARVGASKISTRNIGLGAVFGYTFNGTYDLFGTYKLDASSILPANRRWNSAWAVGAGINMKKLPLIKNIKLFSTMNLRASYGQTANLQGIAPSLVVATFQYGTSGYNGIRSMDLMSLPNVNLKAEQNHIFDIGWSVSIYKTTFSVSYYIRKTINALLNVPVASSSGFQNQLQNVGILENRGLEFSLKQQILATDNWKSSLSFNISYNQNKVLDLYGKQRIYTSDFIPDYELGKATDILYGLQSVGINPLTGLPVFINSKGEEADAYTNFKREDYVDLGHKIPPINGSFSYHLAYKNLSLDMYFYYTMGGKQAYSYQYVRDSDNAVYNAAKNQLNDMWFYVGDENKIYPTAFHTSTVNNNLIQPNSRTVLKSDLIRLSSVNLNYKINIARLGEWAKFIKYATVGASASNLFTITSYKDSDAEVGSILGANAPIISVNVKLTF